jgi:hypothetical protein
VLDQGEEPGEPGNAADSRGAVVVNPKEPEHTPGSPEAIAKGCTCDPVINSGGRGTLSPSGQVAFMPNNDCPLHGIAIVKRLLRGDDG